MLRNDEKMSDYLNCSFWNPTLTEHPVLGDLALYSKKGFFPKTFR